MIIGLTSGNGSVAADLVREIGGFVAVVVLSPGQDLVREHMLHGVTSIVLPITTASQAAACDICFGGKFAGSVALPDLTAEAILDYIEKNPVPVFRSDMVQYFAVDRQSRS